MALAGCGSNSAGDVEATATAFYAALENRDGASACELLARPTRSELEQSSGKPCDEAILEEDLPRSEDLESVDVFDEAGEVRFAGDTTFLTRSDDGWLVVAAGCTPKPPYPYDCTISGG